MIWVMPISKEDAVSLRARLYRVRRRSDASMAAFIPPEYHMVTVGVWDAAEGGRLPLIYSKLPDGKPLPGIVPASPDEVEGRLAIAKLTDAPPDAAEIEATTHRLLESDLSLEPEEVDSFVSKMMAKVTKEQES